MGYMLLYEVNIKNGCEIFMMFLSDEMFLWIPCSVMLACFMLRFWSSIFWHFPWCDLFLSVEHAGKCNYCPRSLAEAWRSYSSFSCNCMPFFLLCPCYQCLICPVIGGGLLWVLYCEFSKFCIQHLFSMWICCSCIWHLSPILIDTVTALISGVMYMELIVSAAPINWLKF